ncbi:MAG TPA: hypothetical protein VHJ99_06770 [Candidatus Dormibacteraeota bacterium]|nr:hypothetical protein [Candidatus Dormibacteraeota bacterium]
MLQRSLAGLAVIFTVLACGGPSLPGVVATGPTASSIAVQPGDLPSGMQKCDLSGDVGTFLNKTKTKDPATYTTTNKEWEDAKKLGATTGYTAFYSDTAAHCTSLESNSSDITTATYKLVVNFVIQFKDEASASKGYTGGSIFGFSASSLKTGGAPVVEGSATGLTANSIVLSISVSNQSFYVAEWQNKAFMVILAILNIDTATCKKVALAENSRIK